ncbi:hypothetical protein D9615_007248 [Tricholomella constricta]|uniref:Uncharacterized protein n=1 Tax=Tricholomella constricta TaxID=117010 RepID=A0A8H5H5N5_9AGAR|nr:hypothetical protein D9615_007248 [Tricholomella constricta]
MDLPQLSDDVEERLDLLQHVAEVLCIDDPSDFSSYSSAITQLTTDSLSAQKLLNRLQFIEHELQTHLAATRVEQRLLAKWNSALEADRGDEQGSAAMIERRKEDLVRKAKEYHEELKAVLKAMPDTPPVSVARLTEQENRNKTREQELKTKRAKIKAFKGLPPNLDLARHELRNARDELGKLTQLRERLLGRMAEGVS